MDILQRKCLLACGTSIAINRDYTIVLIFVTIHNDAYALLLACHNIALNWCREDDCLAIDALVESLLKLPRAANKDKIIVVALLREAIVDSYANV